MGHSSEVSRELPSDTATPKYPSKSIKNICPHKNLFTNCHNSIVHNGQNVETSQMFTNWRMDEHNVIRLYNWILSGNDKGRKYCCNMGEPWVINAHSEYTTNQGTVYFKRVNVKACELYFNKAVIKIHKCVWNEIWNLHTFYTQSPLTHGTGAVSAHLARPPVFPQVLTELFCYRDNLECSLVYFCNLLFWLIDFLKSKSFLHINDIKKGLF